MELWQAAIALGGIVVLSMIGFAIMGVFSG